MFVMDRNFVSDGYIFFAINSLPPYGKSENGNKKMYSGKSQFLVFQNNSK